jgi:hypothetical protein
MSAVRPAASAALTSTLRERHVTDSVLSSRCTRERRVDSGQEVAPHLHHDCGTGQRGHNQRRAALGVRRVGVREEGRGRSKLLALRQRARGPRRACRRAADLGNAQQLRQRGHVARLAQRDHGHQRGGAARRRGVGVRAGRAQQHAHEALAARARARDQHGLVARRQRLVHVHAARQPCRRVNAESRGTLCRRERHVRDALNCPSCPSRRSTAGARGGSVPVRRLLSGHAGQQRAAGRTGHRQQNGASESANDLRAQRRVYSAREQRRCIRVLRARRTRHLRREVERSPPLGREQQRRRAHAQKPLDDDRRAWRPRVMCALGVSRGGTFSDGPLQRAEPAGAALVDGERSLRAGRGAALSCTQGRQGAGRHSRRTLMSAQTRPPAARAARRRRAPLPRPAAPAPARGAPRPARARPGAAPPAAGRSRSAPRGDSL